MKISVGQSGVIGHDWMRDRMILLRNDHRRKIKCGLIALPSLTVFVVLLIPPVLMRMPKIASLIPLLLVSVLVIESSSIGFLCPVGVLLKSLGSQK